MKPKSYKRTNLAFWIRGTIFQPCHCSLGQLSENVQPPYLRICDRGSPPVNSQCWFLRCISIPSVFWEPQYSLIVSSESRKCVRQNVGNSGKKDQSSGKPTIIYQLYLHMFDNKSKPKPAKIAVCYPRLKDLF